MKTVRKAFLQAVTEMRSLPGLNPALEAKLLLLKATALSEQEFWASPDRPLSRGEENLYRAFVRRRLDGWPLAYLTGEKEFWSRQFTVFPGVFIPRPETELLVERVTALSSGKRELIADIGTGSGAIAVSLAKELPRARIVATDVSPRALRAAALNAERLEAPSVTFFRGSLFAPLRALSLEGRVQFLVSNPPYVAEKDWRLSGPEIREHEPKTFLFPEKRAWNLSGGWSKARLSFSGPAATFFLKSARDRRSAPWRFWIEAGIIFRSQMTWPGFRASSNAGNHGSRLGQSGPGLRLRAMFSRS